MSLIKQFITDFIEMYRSEPCLWKMKSKEYANRNMKTKAYEKMVQLLKQMDPDANRETVTKKINNLRTNYRKELKKVIESKKKATCEEEIYVPKLWYFELFNFLQDQEVKRDENFEDTDNEEDNLQSGDESWCRFSSVGQATTIPIPKIENRDTPSPSNSSIFQGKKRKKQYVDSTEEILDLEATGDGQHLQNLRDNDYLDVYGQYVAKKLRGLHGHQRIFAEKLINEVLFEADMETLTREFRIANYGQRIEQI